MRCVNTFNSFKEVIFSIFSSALTGIFWFEVMVQYYFLPVGGADAHGICLHFWNRHLAIDPKRITVVCSVTSNASLYSCNYTETQRLTTQPTWCLEMDVVAANSPEPNPFPRCSPWSLKCWVSSLPTCHQGPLRCQVPGMSYLPKYINKHTQA